MHKQSPKSTQLQLRRLLRFETLVADVAARFVSVPAELLDEVIEAAQRDICDVLEVEHSSLWQVSPTDPERFVLTHLVRDPSLTPPPRVMNSRDFFPWVQSKLVAKELICFEDTTKAPPEAARDAATWREFGIKSTIGIPLSAGGGPVFGVLSFEATTKCRKWPAHLQQRLMVLADVIANALARKQAELKLRESEARVTLAAQSANAGLWTLNPETGEIWATDLTLRLFGLTPGGAFNLDTLMSLVDPRDRDMIRNRIQHALLTGEGENVEYRIHTPLGEERWLISRGRRHSPTGAPPFVLMGVTADITASKSLEQERVVLTRKLLQAQELECARIARELHDDLGQSIALFSVQLHKALTQAQKSASAFSGSLEDLYEKVGQIAHRVSTISHQLHSSELELLGLADAAKHFCREVSELHGIKIAVSVGAIPASQDADINLCLFRVLQEAINNAVRHSRARKISVRIRQAKGRTTLEVADDGIGFDPQSPKRKRGLGLVSMAERLRLVGGDFTMHSEPGKGTRIEAFVPSPALPAEKSEKASRRSRRLASDSKRARRHTTSAPV